MRVPTTGQPLYERRIVREGKNIAERMLNGYSVSANGRFIPDAQVRNGWWMSPSGRAAAAEAIASLWQRAARTIK